MNAQATFVTRIWRRLPAGAMTEKELDAAIMKAAGIREGDCALASAHRGTLMLCGAVTVRRGESGKLVYERAKKLPEWEDMGYGSDAFNRELARASAAAEQERIAELERRRAIEWENSPQAAERRRFFDLIDERTAGLRAEVKELREQVAELQQQPVAAA